MKNIDLKTFIIIAFVISIVFAIFYGLNHYNLIPKIQKRKTVILFLDDGWENQYSVAYPILKMYNFRATFGIITFSIGENSGTEWSYMTTEQVQELSLNNMEIASHSRTHPFLLELTTEELIDELENSKNILESLIEKEIATFIIPYDESNETVESLILNRYQYTRPIGKPIWITNETVEEFANILDDGVFIAYHSLREGNEPYTTSPNLFHSHMKYLHDHNYRVISFKEFLESVG